MVHAQALHLVKREEHPRQKELVLLFEGEGKAVDDGTQNLQQLGNAVETLSLVGELEEDIVDRAADEGSQVKEFAVYAVQGCFQKISLARVLGIEQFEELEDEAVVDVRLCDVGIEVLALDEAEEELVHDLDVRPSDFQDGLVFFRVECLALRVHWGRDRAEQVLRKHPDDDRVHGLRDDLPVVGNIVQELMEGQSLDFLRLHIGASIVEVEYDVALLNLLHEQVLAPSGGHLVETRQLLQFAMGGDIEAGRMLPPRRLGTVENILGSLLQAVVHQGLLASLGRGKIMRHGLGGSGWRYVLY